jgi:hypothetical protein
MGGFRSGRRSDWRRHTIDSCLALDVNLLQKGGGLVPGRSSAWYWTGVGDQTSSIDIHASPDELMLSYRAQTRDCISQEVEERVTLVRAPCPFGGNRPYFICPGSVDGIVCAKRVVKLYALGPYFLCRHCNRVPYSSQGLDSGARAVRRAQKIRERLGGNTNLLFPFPERPKGMWWRTYDGLREEHAKADLRANAAFSVDFRRLSRWTRQSNGRRKSD